MTTTTRLEGVTDEQTIRELDRRWVAAVAARNLDAIASVYADDAVLMMPNAPQAYGRDEISAGWAKLLQAPGVSLSFRPAKIDVAEGGDMASDIGTYTFAMTGPAGRVEDRGKYLVVWKKVNGAWKVLADMFNSSVQPIA
jgi:uncharacterized protein (TIGR02246 family)